MSTTGYERTERLLSFSWTLFRILAAYGLSEYLQEPLPEKRSKKGTDPENLLTDRLTRPSDGDWQTMAFHPLKAVARKREPVLNAMWTWLGERSAQGDTRERQLNTLVRMRNEIRHGAAPASESSAWSRARDLETLMREVLSSMEWMATHRLVRVVRSENLSVEGAFRGTVQVFAGCDDVPEQIEARWRGWLQTERVYLLAPDADRALLVSPFIEVRATEVNPLERVFLIEKVLKSGHVQLLDDRTGEECTAFPDLDGREVTWRDWLAARPHRRIVHDLVDVEGRLGAGATTEPGPATLVDGKYRLREPLGRGAMGVVFRARHEILQRDYALKVIHKELESDVVLAKRFEREARLMTELDSPHVLKARDVGRMPDGRMYIAMDLVSGGTLADAVGEKRDRSDVRRWLLDAARGLEAVHAAGAVHRDVKPANLLVRADGTVVLGDFGVSRADDDPKLTQTLERVGSRAYMAPEVLQGGPATAASDVYALGLVGAELLDGIRPTLSQRIESSDPLTQLLSRMMATESSERPSASDVVRSLQSPNVTKAPPPSTHVGWKRARPESEGEAHVRRAESSRPSQASVPAHAGRASAKKTLAALLVAAVVLAGLAGLVWKTFTGRTRPNEPVAALVDETPPPCGRDTDCALGHRCEADVCVADAARATEQAETAYLALADAYSRGDAEAYFRGFSFPIAYWYNSTREAKSEADFREDRQSAGMPGRDYDVLALTPVTASAEQVVLIEDGRLTYESGRCLPHMKLIVMEPVDDAWRVTGEMNSAQWRAFPGDSTVVPRFHQAECGSVRDFRTGLEWFVQEPRAFSRVEAAQWVTQLNRCCGGESALSRNRDTEWRLPTVSELTTLFAAAADKENHPILDALGDAPIWTAESTGADEAVTVHIASGSQTTEPESRPNRRVRLLAVRGEL